MEMGWELSKASIPNTFWDNVSLTPSSSHLQIGYDKLVEKLELRLGVFNPKVLNIGGEALVEPQICPP